MFSGLAGLIERTVLSLLLSRNKNRAKRIHKPNPHRQRVSPLLMAILVLLCVYCCKHKVYDFVEVLDELYVRYFVSDADQKARWPSHRPPCLFIRFPPDPTSQLMVTTNLSFMFILFSRFS